MEFSSQDAIRGIAESDASPDIHGLIRRRKLQSGAIELLECEAPGAHYVQEISVGFSPCLVFFYGVVADWGEDFEGAFDEMDCVGYFRVRLCSARKRIGGCENGDVSVGYAARLTLARPGDVLSECLERIPSVWHRPTPRWSCSGT
jgi:hypothetical protein